MLSPYTLGQHLPIVLCAVFFRGCPVLLSSLLFVWPAGVWAC